MTEAKGRTMRGQRFPRLLVERAIMLGLFDAVAAALRSRNGASVPPHVIVGIVTRPLASVRSVAIQLLDSDFPIAMPAVVDALDMITGSRSRVEVPEPGAATIIAAATTSTVQRLLEMV
jgi:hypothetical protein